MRFAVLTYVLVLYLSYLGRLFTIVHRPVCSPFKQGMVMRMRVHTRGHHIMVPEASQITNFRARFFCGAF